MSARISSDELYLLVASNLAKRSTCLRRAVGCVLTDTDGKVLATGYNGVANGRPHCNEAVGVITDLFETVISVPPRQVPNYQNACPGASAKSGEQLDACEAIHAEQNALLQCPDVRKIFSCYATCSPCMHCTKLLMNTGCQRIIFSSPYAGEEKAKELWTSVRGRSWMLWHD